MRTAHGIDLAALWRRALEAPDHPFLVDARDGSVFTTAEVDALSRRAVAAHRARGVSTGDRLVVRMGAEIEAWLGLIGALRLGAPVALLHPEAPPAQVEGVLASWPDARLTDWAGAWAASLVEAEPAPSPEPPDPDADAVVLFSSGSTGPARGVRLSWRAIAGGLGRLAQVEAGEGQAGEARGLLRPGAREGVAALLHTVTGCRLSLAPLLRSTTTVLLPPGAGAAELLSLAAQHEVAVLHAGPGFARSVLRSPERHRALVTPTQRAVALGGGAVGEDDRQRLADALGVAVIHTYGLTETAGMIAAAVAVPGGVAPVGMGRPIAPVRIVDEGGGAAAGEGFIEVQPAAPCSGYLGEESPFSTEDRRWVRTGDRGWMDAEGLLHVLGRASRLHTLPSGEKVQIEDVERQIGAALGVEVVVVAAPEPGRDATLGALVAGVSLNPAWERRARLTLREVLGEHAIPRRWRAVPSLPLTPNGKVDLILAAAMLADSG